MEDISDTHNCLQRVINKYGLEEEQDYEEKDRSIARAYNHLLENHLYWYDGSFLSVLFDYPYID